MNERGFTLIEMLVALAVLSLAALALIRLQGQTLRTVELLDDSALAQIVARNVAVEALTDAKPPTTGATQGSEENGGRQWLWLRNVAPLGDAGALRIDVSVRTPEGAERGHLMVVRGPAPPSRPRPAAPGTPPTPPPGGGRI